MKISNVSYNCNCSLVANRYYNPHISQFYATDPLAEKYPNFSPYTYTADNPVMLVDPDGKDWVYNKKTKKYYWDKNVKSKKDIKNSKLYQYIGIGEKDIYKHYKKLHPFLNRFSDPKIDWDSFDEYVSTAVINKVREFLKTKKYFQLNDIRGLKENLDFSATSHIISIPFYYNKRKAGELHLKIFYSEFDNINWSDFKDNSKGGYTFPFQMVFYNKKTRDVFNIYFITDNKSLYEEFFISALKNKLTSTNEDGFD